MNDILKRHAGLSPEKRALVLKKLKEQGYIKEKKSAFQVIEPAPPDARIPLSFAQLRIWMMVSLSGLQNVSGNIQVSLRLKGRLDRDALVKTKDEIMARHEILRARFVKEGEEPYQVFCDEAEMPFQELDLTHLAEDQREERARVALEKEYGAYFDPYEGPMIRLTLIRLEDRDFVLTFVMNHLVSDGWSVGVLAREFMTLYAAFRMQKPSPLAPLPIRYADYAHWQRHYLTGEMLQRHLDFWKRHLQGADEPLALPVDRQPRPGQPMVREQLRFHMDKDLADRCRQLANTLESTLFMVLLAGLQTQLYRYAGQDRISVGSLIAGRNHPQTENLVGVFINTITLRVSLEGNPTFREQVKRTRDVTLDTYAHQALPYEKVVEALRVKQRGALPALFRVMMVLQNMPMGEVSMDEVAVSPFGGKEEKGFSTADLTYQLFEGPDGVGGVLEYNPHIFSAATVHHLGRQLNRLLEAATTDPDRRVDDLPLSTERERAYLVETLNRTRVPYPREATVTGLLEAVVRRSPDAPALFEQGETVSYAELNQRAGQLARYLAERGLRPGDLAALAVPRSSRMIVALLAILRTGAAYLPLATDNPHERLSFMISDAGCRLVLTEQGVYQPPRDGSTPPVIYLNRDETISAVRAMPRDDFEPAGSADHPAYLIYTSGSTGRPKGVVIPHRALVQYTVAAVDLFEITAKDRVLQFASISFDTAAEEIFPCLSAGACLVPRTEEMTHSIERFFALCGEWAVTLLDLPTAYWHTMVDQIDAFEVPRCLRLLILGGDMVDGERLKTWRDQVRVPVRLFNTYGPTEATIVATAWECPAGHATPDPVPIGLPVANTTAYLLDRNTSLVPHGGQGELYLGGEGLARGYWGRADLTAERFVPDPFDRHGSDRAGGSAGLRLYKTGDLVRYLPEGEETASFQFVGRRDHQVKIRGFRIELGEIEAVLRRHDRVEEAVVAAHRDGEGDEPRLVAHLTGKVPDAGVLRAWLRDRLPEYMVPASFLVRDTFPMTPGGKIDRKALPSPETGGEENEEFMPPESKIEIAVAEIWQEVLGIGKVGLLDDFFDIGGNSLMSTRVLYRIKKEFDVALSHHDFFEDPTLGNIAILVVETLLDRLDEEDDGKG